MRLTRTARVDERYGVQEHGEFRIKTSPELFDLLSSGLYTDKIRAVIRELSCNAWDAHRLVDKQDHPFDIHLPNRLEPYFTIRDYGPGLSHEDVLTLYTTYGESTKNDSNLFIGALGVGSKSPFAYGDSFTVSSIFDGMRRSYSAFLSAEGIPSIAMLGDPMTTDQPTGLEISLPVRSSDFEQFGQTAESVLKRFNPLPSITGGIGEFNLEEQEYIIQTSTWRIRREKKSRYEQGANYRANAIQGNIAYPIETSITGRSETLLSLPIDIDFEIGTLDIAASREGLGYKPRTVNELQRRLDEILLEMEELVSNETRNCKSLWQARQAAVKYIGADEPLAACRLSPKFKNQKIDIVISLDRRDFEGLKLSIPSLTEVGNISRGDVPYTGSSTYYFKDPRNEWTGLIVDDLGKGYWPRINHALKNKEISANCIFVRGGDKAPVELKKLKKYLGNPPVKFISKMTKPASSPTFSVADPEILSFVQQNKFAGKRNWVTSTDTVEDAVGFYVEIRNYRPYFNGNQKTQDDGRYRSYSSYYSREDKYNDINTLVGFLRQLGILDKDTEVYGIKTRALSKAKDNPDLVNLYEFAQSKVKALLEKKNIAALLDVKNQVESLRYKIPSWVTNTPAPAFDEVKLPEFRALIEQLRMTMDINDEEEVSNLSKLAKTLEIKLISGNVSKISIGQMIADIESKVPLFMHLDFRWKLSASTQKLTVDYLNMCAKN
jgi:hypothetical protein